MHLYLIGAAIAAAAVFGFGYRVGASSVQGDLDALRMAYTQAALEAEQRVRQIEKEKSDAVAKVGREARDKVNVLAAERDRARVAANKLRVAAQRAGAECRPAETSIAPSGSETAATSGLVLADVLGRCANALVAMAEHADRTETARDACERAYKAVSE